MKNAKKMFVACCLLLLIAPSAALAKGGGHGGGHGGHAGSHGGGAHVSGGGGKSGSAGKSGGSKSGGSGAKSGSHSESGSHSYTSPHSVLNGGGKTPSAKAASRASSVGTPVSSWNSINKEAEVRNSTPIPPFYRGNSAINQLFYYPLYNHSHSHVVPSNTQETTDEEADKEEIATKSIFKTVFIMVAAIGGCSALVMLVTSFLKSRF